MARRRVVGWRATTVAALGLFAFAGFAPTRAAGLDPAQMSVDEIKALQQRLTDVRCYMGAIDGAASAALNAAIKACPNQQPFLRIEVGTHTGKITSIGVDAACSLLATASEDKTVRLWSARDGTLKRVVRLPIGEGNAGKIYATALSPGGLLLAVGGWDAAYDKSGKYSLEVIDLTTGAIRRFGPFDDVIESIRFSPNGRRVAVGLGGKSGVHVLDTATGTEVRADRFGTGIYGLAYALDGALIALSLDGQLRRYSPDLKRADIRKAPDGKGPISVAVDPLGRRVAVGYELETQVFVLDAKTLDPLAKAQTSDLSDAIPSVAWSRDGSTLLAGGRAQAQFHGEWRHLLRRFDAAGGRQGDDVAMLDSAITDIEPCGEGFAFATADPAFGLVSATGVASFLQEPHTADMRGKKGFAFAISPDAGSVRFGLGVEEKEPVVFDLNSASLTDSPGRSTEFLTAKIDGLPVTDWNSFAPKFDGVKLPLQENESSRALAIRPGASGFALGTDWWVRSYNASGKELWEQLGPSVAWGVDFSADGEILTVAYGDGTIRWLRWSDGAELLALFVERRSRKWVAWTPSGYYMASAGGEDLIGWHVNRGWEQEAEWFTASQFRDQYNRPDIVQLVLQTRDEAEAIRRGNAATHAAPSKPVAVNQPTVMTILSPADGSHFSGDSITIGYSLRSRSGLPIDRLDVLADGEPIKATGFVGATGPEASGSVIARPPKKDTSISLIAYSGGLRSAPVSVKLVYDHPTDAIAPAPSAATPPDTRPRLYALLVGVTNYEDHELNDIQFGARDAEGLAQALEGQKGGLYADVQTKIVDFPTSDDILSKVIGPPTRDNVFKGLYWLKKVMTDNDLAVIFLSGHGYRDYSDPKQGFWFLTREAQTDQLPTTAISGVDLLGQISTLSGKKLLFVDACHVGTDLTANTMALPSEAFPNMDKFVNDFTTAGTGIVVYAASQATELAHEDQEDRHGAFAEALIEAIGDGKGSNPDGRITTDLLHFYIVDRVKYLTNGAQHPVWNHPGPVSDFPVAVARH